MCEKKKERKKEKVIHESDEQKCILMVLLGLQMAQCPAAGLAVSSRSARVHCEGFGHTQSHETIIMIKFRRGSRLAAQGLSVLWTFGTYWIQDMILLPVVLHFGHMAGLLSDFTAISIAD